METWNIKRCKVSLHNWVQNGIIIFYNQIEFGYKPSPSSLLRNSRGASFSRTMTSCRLFFTHRTFQSAWGLRVTLVSADVLALQASTGGAQVPENALQKVGVPTWSLPAGDAAALLLPSPWEGRQVSCWSLTPTTSSSVMGKLSSLSLLSGCCPHPPLSLSPHPPLSRIFLCVICLCFLLQKPGRTFFSPQIWLSVIHHQHC